MIRNLDWKARALRAFFACAAAVGSLMLSYAAAKADDGYDVPFAVAVRAATDQYRLLLWASQDGYVQSTDYVAGLGTMYTNHERFDPPDLDHPTVLIYDQAGRLVACEYQFLTTSAVPAAFSAVPASAWFDIPRHLHYNIRIGDTDYYAQAEWPTDDQPTAAALIARKLMPADATLLFAFVHPATRTFIVWAWLPNSDGLFAGDNSLMP
jgi:hypothetical protein